MDLAYELCGNVTFLAPYAVDEDARSHVEDAPIRRRAGHSEDDDSDEESADSSSSDDDDWDAFNDITALLIAFLVWQRQSDIVFEAALAALLRTPMNYS